MTEETYDRKLPSTAYRENSRRKARRKRKRHQGKILLAVILFLLVGGSLLFAKTHGTAIQAQLDILPDANARQGTLYGESPQELDGGSFWVLVNQLPTMVEGSQACSIKYENPSSNHYSARISLYLMETGELLGYTRRVDPGNYVETIRIKKELPVGEYPVRANLELFQDKTPAGNMSLEMFLRVTEEPQEEASQSQESDTASYRQENDMTSHSQEDDKTYHNEESSESSHSKKRNT